MNKLIIPKIIPILRYFPTPYLDMNLPKGKIREMTKTKYTNVTAFDASILNFKVSVMDGIAITIILPKICTENNNKQPKIITNLSSSFLFIIKKYIFFHIKNIVCVYIPKKRKNYLFQADIDKYYVQKNEKT